MKLTNFIFTILLFQAIVGCNNSSEEADATIPETSTTPAAAPATAVATDTIESPSVVPATAKAAPNPPHGQPGHRCDIAVGAPLDSKPTQPNINTTPTQPVTVAPVPVPSAATTVAAGVNPAHGQPNHRCDIAVGAPLNSKPNTPALNVNPQPVAPPVGAAPPPPLINLRPGETTAAGKNPAHGQPGHRCDIAVGAPLNSKPPQ
jgi:hypothetical protein